MAGLVVFRTPGMEIFPVCWIPALLHINIFSASERLCLANVTWDDSVVSSMSSCSDYWERCFNMFKQDRSLARVYCTGPMKGSLISVWRSS